MDAPLSCRDSRAECAADSPIPRMSSVFSKLIDGTSARCGVRQETLTRGVAGAATALYLLKLTYPYILTCLKAASRKRSLKSAQSRSKDRDRSVLQNGSATGSGGGRQKLSFGLDRDFFRRLMVLLKIMVPGWRTREMGLLTCATLTLLARTFLSVYVAELEGQIVKRIVLRDVHGFGLMLARWFAIALPATFVNSAIRYLEGRLALSFRYAPAGPMLSLTWMGECLCPFLGNTILSKNELD